MTEKEYYIVLKDAYSDINLNKISAEIISYYKSGEYSMIKKIAKIVSDYIPINEEKISKCFSRLIMIYHPDKGNHYRKEIDAIYDSGSFENLHQYSHILAIQDLDILPATGEIDEDIDYSPEYQWDEDDPGFNYFYDSDDEQFDHETDSFDDPEPDNSFFAAIKAIKMVKNDYQGNA